MYRPSFIEKENMFILGFDLQKDENGYLVYHNNASIQYNKDYSQYPEPKGKVIIYVNTTYSDNAIFIGIMQDGGTRTVYNGICNTEIFLKLLLNNIR